MRTRKDRMAFRCFSTPTWRLALVACLLSGCGRARKEPLPAALPEPPAPVAPRVAPVAREAGKELSASPVALAARQQVGQTLHYDPAYVGLAYPGGDLPIEKGVCTDVVVRALRTALNLDLQQAVHEDMRAAFSAYPDNWGLRKPDPNIDHRRVPNLRRYFERQGYSLAITKRAGDYLPGDLVSCTVGKRPHIMVVSDRKTPGGLPLVIHNIGRGTREEDRLFAFPLTGHYRVKE